MEALVYGNSFVASCRERVYLPLLNLGGFNGAHCAVVPPDVADAISPQYLCHEIGQARLYCIGLLAIGGRLLKPNSIIKGNEYSRLS